MASGGCQVSCHLGFKAGFEAENQNQEPARAKLHRLDISSTSPACEQGHEVFADVEKTGPVWRGPCVLLSIVSSSAERVTELLLGVSIRGMREQVPQRLSAFPCPVCGHNGPCYTSQ